MLERVVTASIAHRWFVLLGAVLLTLYGVATVERARYDVFPEFVPAQANVQTEAPGLTPEQVETLVTRPLEVAINGANGVANVRSQSIQGLSVIDVTFRDGADPYRARQIVAEAVGEAARNLPANAAAPVLTPLTSSTMDLLKIGFTSARLDPMALRTFVEFTVRPRMLATPGVARAVIYGGQEPRYEVRVRPADLIARNIAVGDVSAALAAITTVRGGGFADTGAQRILVEPAAPRIDAAALGAALIPVSSGPAVAVSDVADVVRAPMPAVGDALIMGRPGVLMAMSSQYGANTLETTRAVEATLADLRPALAAQGIDVEPALHRPANFITTALRGISIDLAIGALMIGIVLLAFLRDGRVALIAFVSIPLSLLAALIVLDWLGFTVNTMTLGGLAVALGVVVDDAVVDIENIVRRLRQHADCDPLTTIAAAAIEVRAPVVYATLLLALTIAPVLFLTGLQGAFFAPLALAFLLAVIASLAVAMVVTPALAALLLAGRAPKDEAGGLARLKNWHRRALEGVVDQPRRVVTATALLSVAALAVFAMFGAELLPAFRERHYVIALTGPPGASLDWMRGIGTKVSRDLLALPGVATIEQQIGRAEAGEDAFPPNESELHVELKASVEGAGEKHAQAAIRAALARYPGVQSEVVTFLGDRIGESLSGETAAVAISVYGADLGAIDATAGRIATALAKVPGAADIAIKAPPGTPALRIRLDPARMQPRGITATDAYDAVEIAFQGRVAAQVVEADRVTEVAVALPPEMRLDPESVGQVPVRAADGGTARLDDIADLRLTETRSVVEREGGQRRQVVTVNPTRGDIAGFVSDARTAIARLGPLPAGVSLGWSGVAEGQKAASRQLLVNVAVAAIGIVALLIFAFDGGRAAALILAGAPFALAGGVVAVALTGGILSLGALVGFVTLFGIAARNAILLVSHVDQLVDQEGAPFDRATVMRAAEERLTPILLTALVTALGLVPLALEADQAGREVQGPMAIVILGGLVTSTAMSLLLLPALVLRFRRAP